LPDLHRLGELALDVVGQLPDMVAARVSEGKVRLGEWRRIAVGPGGEERIARGGRAAGGVVVGGSRL
jgi:hypothetical protein